MKSYGIADAGDNSFQRIELERDVEQLERKVAILERTIDELERRIEALENRNS